MRPIKEALQIWQDNGMDKIVSDIWRAQNCPDLNPEAFGYEEKAECALFSEKFAKILYNLNFSDFFRTEKINKRDICLLNGSNTYLALINLFDSGVLTQCQKHSAAYQKILQKHNIGGEYKDLAGEIMPGAVQCAEFLCPEKPGLMFENAAATLEKFASRGDDAEDISSIMRNVYSIDYENSRNFKAMQLKYLQEMLAQNTDTNLIKTLNSAFYTIYSDRAQRLSESTYTGLLQNVLPEAITNKDSLFRQQTNMYGTQNHTYGIGDYTYQAYTSKVTPAHLHELRTIAKELPATEFEIFQSNRQDGIALAKTYGMLRDLIHDEVRGISDVIEQMTAFYDSKGQTPTDKIVKALGENHPALDLESYDYQVTYRTKGKKEITESNIAILRRLQQNMQKNRSRTPQNGGALQPVIDKIAESRFVPGQELQKLLAELNKSIENDVASEKIGIKTTDIDLINWTDRKIQQYLNDMDFEEQCGFYKMPLCREILKFGELTNSPANTFSPDRFEYFYQTKIFNAPTISAAYENIASRQNQNMFGLIKMYNQIAEKNRIQAKLNFSDPDAHYSDNFKSLCFADIEAQRQERLETIISGNSLKALQNLTQYKQASSKIGARYRQELIDSDPLRRDFDILLKDMSKKGIDLSFHAGKKRGRY